MAERCPSCDLDVERNPGAFIGGIGVNTVVSFLAVITAIVAVFVFTHQPRSILSLLIPVLAVALIVPLAFFPLSKSLWLAIEYLAVPPGDEPPPTASINPNQR